MIGALRKQPASIPAVNSSLDNPQPTLMFSAASVADAPPYPRRKLHFHSGGQFMALIWVDDDTILPIFWGQTDPEIHTSIIIFGECG
jgi:hypothetical protein